jgi:hypothetical protein
MHRSSESIASLAGALAKAQAELTNPEKSLTAIIRTDGCRGGQQTFRYAPLSSGLDIVRKILGQHEIATVQTTAIDLAAGTVNLTTVLAHASGQWIASDWPVCAISETASPRRMGAALTYARRYALFTLVGIAGEDDLDAPDLITPTGQVPGADKSATSNGNGWPNGGGGSAVPNTPVRRKMHVAPRREILAPDKSTALRDQLLSELGTLVAADAVTTWAQRILAAKNSLTTHDARCIEGAFQSKLATFGGSDAGVKEPPPPVVLSARISLPKKSRRTDRRGGEAPRRIDKSALTLPEPRRIRDKEHLRYVAQQACLICGRKPSDPHHLRFAQHPALGRKVSDEFTVPLCRGHHREAHTCGDETKWWRKTGLDPAIAARALWLKTHPLRRSAKNAVAAVIPYQTTAVDGPPAQIP